MPRSLPIERAKCATCNLFEARSLARFAGCWAPLGAAGSLLPIGHFEKGQVIETSAFHVARGQAGCLLAEWRRFRETRWLRNAGAVAIASPARVAHEARAQEDVGASSPMAARQRCLRARCDLRGVSPACRPRPALQAQGSVRSGPTAAVVLQHTHARAVERSLRLCFRGMAAFCSRGRSEQIWTAWAFRSGKVAGTERAKCLAVSSCGESDSRIADGPFRAKAR